MSLSIQGQHAVITGAGSGINLAFAKLLLSKGCSVLIGDLSSSPDIEGVLAAYPHPPVAPDQPSALFHQTDVRSWPQLTSLWDAALEAFPSVEIVVPGAGIFEPASSAFWAAPKTATNPDSSSRDAADADPGHYATLDINLVAPIRLSQMAIGYWTQRKLKGNLLHLGSIAGYIHGPGLPLYFASKHGLHGFVRSLGSLRDQLGIRVSAVAPGPVKTALWEKDSTRAQYVSDDPIWITPEAIALKMYELLTDEMYGNGTILEVTAKHSRVIPLYGLEPPIVEEFLVKGMSESSQKLLADLKATGLKT